MKIATLVTVRFNDIVQQQRVKMPEISIFLLIEFRMACWLSDYQANFPHDESDINEPKPPIAIVAFQV